MGSVADWVNALAAIGALGAAIYAGLVARHLYEIESNRDLAASTERRREQATAISAWVSVTAEENYTAGVEIINVSPAPVYDVRIEVNDRNGTPLRPLTLTVLPPGRFFASTDDKYGWSFPNPSEAVGKPLRPVARSNNWRVQQLSFRDSADVHWARDADGTLTEVAAAATAQSPSRTA